MGPGDYDPCLPKSAGLNAGACSLGFTAPKLLPPTKHNEDCVPDDEKQAGSFFCKDRRESGLPPNGLGAERRSSSIGTARLSTSSSTTSVSRLIHVELEQQVCCCVFGFQSRRFTVVHMSTKRCSLNGLYIALRCNQPSRGNSAISYANYPTDCPLLSGPCNSTGCMCPGAYGSMSRWTRAQAKQLAWSEREREKLQAEAAKLREREVSKLERVHDSK